MPAVRVLFVCMGNICRSPTAEGVMRALVAEAGLSDRIELDSAGTGGWHAGAPPDARASAAAALRGIELDGAARRVRQHDFEEFDLLVALDADNAHAAPGAFTREAEALRWLSEPQAPAHAALFGGGYGSSAVAAMRRCV